MRNELTDLIIAGFPVPRFIISAWAYANFAGQVLLRMWLMLFSSRGSGYEAAGFALHSANKYVGLLWQGLVSAAEMSGVGPLGTVEALPADRLRIALPG